MVKFCVYALVLQTRPTATFSCTIKMEDEEYDLVKLVKFLKGKSKVWGPFSFKRNWETQEIAESVGVCDRCLSLVKYIGGTTKLTLILINMQKYCIPLGVIF